MKVVMTLIVRDEADIVDDHIRYHLEAGVDFVVATDHRSADATTEILQRYEREGHLKFIRELGEAYRQSEWVTRMARLAATEFGADWVINSDADEFWWPRIGTLRDVLSAVPARFGAIRGTWRHFVLRPDAAAPFFERMTVRRTPSLDVTNPYCANAKVVHRARADVTVVPGNHDARGPGLLLLREWVPFEVFHFPIRGREQLERKYPAFGASYELAGKRLLPRHVAAIASGLRANAEDVYRTFLVDDVSLEDGLDDGTLAIDTRLRDRLRGEAPERPTSLEDDLAFAEEVDAMLSLDSAHRLATRVDSFNRRLAAVEARRRRAFPRRRRPV